MDLLSEMGKIENRLRCRELGFGWVLLLQQVELWLRQVDRGVYSLEETSR